MEYKYSFFNDYSEGAHPRILERINQTNLEQMTGYGEDELSLEAIEAIKGAAGSRDSDVHFVSGGTQANLICLASMLKPYESVISANTGHINVHEAGAIEATGHRINAIDSKDGKLSPEMMGDLVKLHEDEHMVKPKVIFISNSTEVGTVYTKDELQALREFADQHNLYLYMDGARLGSALTSQGSDLTLPEITKLTDMFYIGGTKNGAMLGEAIIISNPQLKSEFRRHIKQRGGLLSKGRFLGVQFSELFKEDLFFELGKHANLMASKLQEGIKSLGYQFLTDSSTNQIFPILPNAIIEVLQKEYGFYVWGKHDETSSSIRLVTSWATEAPAIEQFLVTLGQLSAKA